MKYNNGEIYNGDWKNDLKEGKGTYIYRINENDIIGIKEKKYIGEFKNDQIDGE